MTAPKNHLFYKIFPAVLTFVLFVLIFLSFEFYVTEVKMLTTKIPNIFGSFFVVLLILVFSLIDWEKKIKFSVLLLFTVIGFGVATYGNVLYTRAKINYKSIPRIYSVEPKEGYQGQTIKIKGTNFFQIESKGKIFLGKDEIMALSWKDDEVTFLQPVPSKFGKVDLYLVRSDGKKSFVFKYFVKNPSELPK